MFYCFFTSLRVCKRVYVCICEKVTHTGERKLCECLGVKEKKLRWIEHYEREKTRKQIRRRKNVT